MPQVAVRARQRPQLPIKNDLGRKHRPDYWLLTLSAALLAIGLVVVYAIGPALAQANHVSSNYYVQKQLVAIALSIVVFLVTAQMPLDNWRRNKYDACAAITNKRQRYTL